MVRSGRAETYESGKDTGRFWDAGATNVHWVIATDTQLGKGIQQAMQRVKARLVFVEGNSFSEFVKTDCMLLVRGAVDQRIKKSAKKIIEKATAIEVTNIYDELPVVINHVRRIFSTGTTQNADTHLTSAGLIRPLTQVG